MKIFRAMLVGIMLLPACAVAYNYVTPGQFIGARTLVSFWGNDCGDCKIQLPILISFVRYHPNVNIAIVVLHGNGSGELPKDMPANMRIYSEEDGATSLRNFGATREMLPFNAFLKEDASVCTSHAGLQGLAMFEDWAKQC